MGKISTKEEVNLAYIQGKFNLLFKISHRKVEQNDETRQAVVDLGDPQIAYYYALCIDKRPTYATREVCLEDPDWTYYYALHVDKGPRPSTKKAVRKSKYRKNLYKHFVEGGAYD